MGGPRRRRVGASGIGANLRGGALVLVVAVLGAACSSATTAGSTSTEATAPTPAATPTTVPPGFALVAVTVPAAYRSAAFKTSRSLVVPTGWTVEVRARVPGARFAIWTPEHQLLLSVPGSGEIVELTPGASAGAVPTKKVLVSGLTQPQGMAFDTIGGHQVLYVAESDQIDRYPWKSTGAVGSRKVLVTSLPDANADGAPAQVITSYVRDHPPDELAKLTPGRNVGWPYCNPDPDVSPGLGETSPLQYADLPFNVDVQTNPKGKKLDCATLQSIDRGVPAHSAPLGFHFLEGSTMAGPWSNGAVVAAHGSWDRTPPRAPAVLWFPWEAQQETLGNQVDLVTGFQLPNGTRWGRPVDAVPGPDGDLYVPDDTAGAVYRIGPAAT